MHNISYNIDTVNLKKNINIFFIGESISLYNIAGTKNTRKQI